MSAAFPVTPHECCEGWRKTPGIMKFSILTAILLIASGVLSWLLFSVILATVCLSLSAVNAVRIVCLHRLTRTRH
jgi:hypothetical protein